MALENCDLGDIDGYVWLDENANSIFNNNEIGIPNVQITLTSLLDTTITNTDSTGYYEFSKVELGEYTITIDTLENLNLITEAQYEVNIPLPNDTSYSYNFGFVDTLCDKTAITNEFSWLNDIIDFNNCTGIFIKFYNFANYQFLEIIGNGNNQLYRNDGTFYCEDSEGFSCAEFYCFNIPFTTWNCCEDSVSEPNTCHAISNYPWIAKSSDSE